MLVSTAWLSDLVDTGKSADEIATLLTMAGLEVEGVEKTGPTFDGVVVGHVLDVRPHAGADRLRVCSVDVGAGEPVQIVCGAPNVAAGQTVPVATVGTVLELPSREDPSAREPVTIKKSKIRGETSVGMICAEDELGIGTSHDGILVLDEATPGLPFADYLDARGLRGGDAVLDVNVTPNRPDATSHTGVARDLAALTGAALTLPAVEMPEPTGAFPVSIYVHDAEGCPRYVALIVDGVTVGPSPAWMVERLGAIGVRSVNNVVDVTNVVLHETGQPLHAFDLDQLGDVVIVRRSTPGEALVTLDGVRRDLPEGTLVIADDESPVAVAGVMGGQAAEVRPETTRVLIESAAFDAPSVRRASKRLGLSTDASYRFERGVDPTGQLRAAARAASLLAEVAGGRLLPGVADVVSVPFEPTTVTLRVSRIERLLGVAVPADEARRLLTAIGFTVSGDDETLAAVVPPWRPDVTREVDAIEEVARLVGLDRLPDVESVSVSLAPAPEDRLADVLDRMRRRLAVLGFHDLATNSLVSAQTAAAYADPAWTGTDRGVVETLNPVSQEMAALRPSLLPGLVQAAAYNAARGSDALRLVDVGHVYGRASAGDDTLVDGYAEASHIALALWGTAERQAWDRPARAADFYDLKGLVLDVLADAGVTGVEETAEPAPSGVSAYRLVLSAQGRRLGAVGRLSSAPQRGGRSPWQPVRRRARRRGGSRRGRPRGARPLRGDLAATRPSSATWPSSCPRARPRGRCSTRSARPGARCSHPPASSTSTRGDRIADGTQSLAFALTFGADRTLRDAEVDGRVKRVVAALEKEHGATLRA